MSEHYQLIRTSPEYRNFLMLEEMRAEMQPPLYQPEGVAPAEEGEPIEIEHRYLYHHFHSDLSKKQAHSIENNTNQILSLKKIINTLIGKRRPKSKY